MTFLIDTHVLLWYLDGSERLPNKIRKELNNSGNIVIISIASLWELTIKMALKKIDSKTTLPEIETHLYERAFTVLNITFKHLNTLLTLPHHHGDPFDRLLISQAISENLTIISADKLFGQYPVKLIW